MIAYFVTTPYDIQTTIHVGPQETGTTVPTVLPSHTVWPSGHVHRLTNLAVIESLIKIEIHPKKMRLIQGYMRLTKHVAYKLGLMPTQMELFNVEHLPRPYKTYSPNLRSIK